MDVISLIKFEENLKLKPYLDTEGLLSIGWGRCLETAGISADEAEYLLQNDIEHAIFKCNCNFHWFADLNEVRQAVLISMMYQLGENGLMKFKNTLGMIALKDYEGAAKEMLDSIWAKQTPNRAKRASDMMRTGIWWKE